MSEKPKFELIVPCPAIQAESPVNADGPAAVRAAPSFIFFLDECGQPVGFHGCQIPQKARVVSCPVSIVQFLQPPAGKLPAVVAELGFCFGQEFAVHDAAVATVTGIVLAGDPAACAPVLFSKIGQAGPAIHAARGDQGLVDMDGLSMAAFSHGAILLTNGEKVTRCGQAVRTTLPARRVMS
jgi:hypothetical protein